MIFRLSCALTIVLGSLFVASTIQTHNYDLMKAPYPSAPWIATYFNKGMSPWVHVDFDESMQTKQYSKEIAQTTRLTGINCNILYHSLKGLYHKNNLSNIVPTKTLRIPKIIHQIWLGGQVPNCFKEYMTSWTKYHLDGWQYILWTDKEIEQLELYTREYYNSTDNDAIKADLLKMEIIYRYGGVYIDTDFECLRPLDILHYTYDFYIGIQPLDSQFLQLGNAIFGARAGHPILKHCIETIKNDWQNGTAPQKAGSVYITMSFYLISDLYGNVDIALPASYFYPSRCTQKTTHKELWTAHGAYGTHW